MDKKQGHAERIFRIQFSESEWHKLLRFLDSASHPRVFYAHGENMAESAAKISMESAHAALLTIASCSGMADDQIEMVRAILRKTNDATSAPNNATATRPTEDEARMRQLVESVLLGHMRDHPDHPLTLAALDKLDLDDFKFLKHQFVFGAIRSLKRRGMPVDTMSIVRECATLTSGLHSSYWVQAWLVDAMGGDLDPVLCYHEIKTSEYPADNSCSN